MPVSSRSGQTHRSPLVALGPIVLLELWQNADWAVDPFCLLEVVVDGALADRGYDITRCTATALINYSELTLKT